MVISTIHVKGLGATAAIALVLAMAAPAASHAESRSAGHPAHVNALPRPPMRSLQGGTVVTGPAAQAQPLRVMPSSVPSVAFGHAEDIGHARDQGHVRGPREPHIIVVGVPSTYYDGAPIYDAPGYYGDPYSDSGATLGASPLDPNVASCAQAYSSYDPQSGTYIGDDGNAHPCP